MEVPDKRKDNRVLIFTILMVGALASIIAMYIIALPYMEVHNQLDIALILAIFFIVIAYVMIVKPGVPPAPPKTKRNPLGGDTLAAPAESADKTVKPGIPPAPPERSVKTFKSGVAPASGKSTGQAGKPGNSPSRSERPNKTKRIPPSQGKNR
jgi:hypothetical protein